MPLFLRKSTGLFRDSHGRGLGPLLLGGLVFTGLLFGARALTRKLPSLHFWPGDHQTGIVYVDAGEDTFAVHGKLESADLLVVGDSRVSSAIVPPRFREAGLGDVAYLWAGAARLGALVKLAEDYPELPIVIAMSPLSFSPRVHPVIAEVNRHRHPAFDVNRDPRSLESWAEQETEHLLAAGFDAQSVERVVTRARRKQAQFHQQRNDLTGEIDGALSRWLDIKRCRLVTPLMPMQFKREWARKVSTSKNDNSLSWALRGDLRKERETEANLVFKRLSQIPKERKIALIRLPVSPSLRKVEDKSFELDWLGSRIERMGRPFKDFGAGDYETHDGSHITWPAAERLSAELAAWLRDDLGW